ncbi:hypothetical protein RHMOL_Rhmol02G0046400 [Rhododendron molle]|uniref:Uncharacterized protein n=1 Tax=Rhododendron molle TaxID=49168 RepID=A0ACC0PLB3_RHOML|nr:hypothetical protein RHMOL_Rhmol02G0046400 [Rhododendron molle]
MRTRRIAAVALILSPTTTARNYRKGNPFVHCRTLLFHTQFSPDPNPPDVIPLTNRQQLQKLLSEKSKTGFDKLNDGLSLFHQMARFRPLPSVVHFTQLLTAVAKMKEYSTVISLCKEIRELGIPINEYTLNILINCFCRLSRVDFGFAILGIFYKCGHTPDVTTFTTLINGYVLEGDTAMAIRLLRSTQKWNYKPTVVMYNIIIGNLCKDGNIDDALRLLSEMRKWDIMPDVVTYSCLVDGFCKSGRGKDATRILSDMTEQNIIPDVITFNMLVDAICKEGPKKRRAYSRSWSEEGKAEYKPPVEVSPNLWRDCWIIRAPRADGCSGSYQKVVKVYDISDGEQIMKWEVQKPVLAMNYSSPLQWRNRGKVVAAEAESVSLWIVSSLDSQTLLSISSCGQKVSALHVNSSDAKPGGGVRQRVSSSEAEGNDGVFCTPDSINLLDFRHPSGVGLKIPKLGVIATSVFSRGDSIFLGCNNARSSGMQQFSLRKQKLFQFTPTTPP